MGLIFNGNGDVIKAVDGSLTVEGLDFEGGGNVNAGIGTFTDVKVTGTLTYEDVKNVDSVGIISARQSIHVGYGVSAAGIVTATSFSGSGASLTALNATNLGSGTVPTARLGSGTANNSVFLRGDSSWAAVTQTTINNNANNRLITGSGTANTLEGEANLTYNGNTFSQAISNAGNGMDVFGAGDHWTSYVGSSNRSSANVWVAKFAGQWNRNDIASIACMTGADTTNKDEGQLAFYTTPSGGGETERLRITSAGLVGINNTPSTAQLVVKNSDDANRNSIDVYNDNGNCSSSLSQDSSGSGSFLLKNNSGTIKTFIKSYGDSYLTGGRLLLGTTTNSSPIGWNNNLQIAGTNAQAGISIRRDSADTGGAILVFGKSRGSLNGNTVVQNGDQIGGMYFAGGDGTDVNSIAAQISVEVDGTPGGNDMPGRLLFKTTPDGSAAAVERLRINSSGHMILSPSGYSLPTGDERTLNIVAWGNKPASLGFQRSNSLGGTTSGWTNELQSNGDLIWGVHNVGEKLRITAAGRVGINENSPDRDLHISNTTPYIRVESTSANQPATLELYHTRGNGSDKWPSSIATADGALTLNVATGNNGAPQEKVRIASDGRMMFGSTSHVGQEWWLFRKDVGGGGATCQLTVYNASNDSVNNTAKVSLRTNHSETTFCSYNQGEVYISNPNAASYFMMYLGGQERVRVNNGGSIGLSHTLSGTSNYNRLMIHNPHDGSCWMQMTSTASGTGANSDGLSIGLNSSNVAHFWQRENADILFGTANTSRWNIKNNGHIVPVSNNAYDLGTNSLKVNKTYSSYWIHRHGQSGGVSQNESEAIFIHGGMHFFHDYITLSSSNFSHGICGNRTYNLIRMKNAGSGAAIYAESGAISSGSDYRMKENIAPIIGGIEAVKKLKPCTYNIRKSFNEHDGGGTHQGFIAHEVQEAIPDIVNIVNGNKDDMEQILYMEEDDIPEGKKPGDPTGKFSGKPDMQGIDYGHMTPILCAALKEAITKIETLEAEVAALKSA